MTAPQGNLHERDEADAVSSPAAPEVWVSWRAGRVWEALCRLAGDKRSWRGTQAVVARESGYGLRSVQLAIEELKVERLVEVDRHGNAWAYRLARWVTVRVETPAPPLSARQVVAEAGSGHSTARQQATANDISDRNAAAIAAATGPAMATAMPPFEPPYTVPSSSPSSIAAAAAAAPAAPLAAAGEDDPLADVVRERLREAGQDPVPELVAHMLTLAPNQVRWYFAQAAMWPPRSMTPKWSWAVLETLERVCPPDWSCDDETGEGEPATDPTPAPQLRVELRPMRPRTIGQARIVAGLLVHGWVQRLRGRR